MKDMTDHPQVSASPANSWQATGRAGQSRLPVDSSILQWASDAPNIWLSCPAMFILQLASSLLRVGNTVCKAVLQRLTIWHIWLHVCDQTLDSALFTVALQTAGSGFLWGSVSSLAAFKKLVVTMSNLANVPFSIRECGCAGRPQEETCEATFELFGVALPLQRAQRDPDHSAYQIEVVTKSLDATGHLNLGLELLLDRLAVTAELGTHDSSVPAHSLESHAGSMQQSVILGVLEVPTVAHELCLIAPFRMTTSMKAGQPPLNAQVVYDG